MMFLLLIILPAKVFSQQDYLFRHFYTPERPLTNIVNIEEDSNGFIWVSSAAYGVFRFDGEQYLDLAELSGVDSLSDLRGDILVDSDNRLWVHLAGESLVFDCNTNRVLERRVSDDTFDYLRGVDRALMDGLRERFGYVQSVQSLGDGRYLVGVFRRGLVLYDMRRGSEQELIPNDIIRDIEPQGDGSYWVASESGLYRYYANTGVLERTQKNWKNPYGLADNAVYSVKRDSQGGLWVGTYFRGLSYIPPRVLDYRYLNPSISNSASVGNVVRTIVEDDMGRFWIGTEDGGVNCYDRSSHRVTNYSRTNSVNTLSGTNVHGLVNYRGLIWVGTFKEGIDVIDPRTGRLEAHYQVGDGSGLLDNFVLEFKELRDGRLYVGTSQGVQVFDPRSRKFQTILYNVVVISMCLDNRGWLWVASFGGLYCQREDGVFTLEEVVDGEHHVSQMVNYVMQDNRGVVWIGSDSGLFSYEQGGYKYHDVAQDRLTREIRSVVQDNFSNLWLSTSHGLVRYNPLKQEVIKFPFTNKAASSRFNYNSAYRERGGDISFGSLNGMVTFTPQERYDMRLNKKVVISGLAHIDSDGDNTYYNKIYRNLTDSSYLNTLSHNQNFINISLHSSDYSTDRLVRYAYDLEGYTQGWVETERNTVELQNLSYGDYLFRVRAVDYMGRYSDVESTLRFTIRPPFYATVLARVFYVLLFFVAIAGFVVYLKRREKRKRLRFEERLSVEKDKELFEAKIDFFTTIAHEIRTPLTLIKAPLEQIEANPSAETVTQNLPIAMRHTQWLSNLCTQLLDFRSVEKGAHKLNLSVVDLNRLVREIVDDFRGSFEVKGACFESNLIENNPVLAVLDVDVFRKVFGNLLQNALKYSDKYICVNLLRSGDSVALSVLNDGELLNADDQKSIFSMFARKRSTQQGSGVGLAFARELVGLHGWQLDLVFDNYSLNHFRVSIPINKAKEAGFTPSAPTQGTQTLLIVEDNEELREYIERLFATHYRVLTAEDGVQALERLEQCEGVSLIISDVMMPRMDGVELCRRVKSQSETSHLPLILLTADVSISSKLSAMECGADDYIEKPFSEKYLQARVKNILESRRRLYEEFSHKPLATLPSTPEQSVVEREFVTKLRELIETQIDNAQLDVDFVATHFGMSRATLYRKAKSNMDISVSDFITLCRLKRAAQLLAQKQYSVSEVAYMVGFSTPSYFSKCFSKQFSVSPTEFVENVCKNGL